MTAADDYNSRLFSGRGLRSRVHFARFSWFQRCLKRCAISADTVLEFGCYDGKLIEWFPVRPSRYLGVDANWEGGLDLAVDNYAGVDDVEFLKSSTIEGLAQLDGSFSLTVAMETLEHLPASDADAYLEQLISLTEGHIVITVPVEFGPVFAIKWIVKQLFLGGAERYTLAEFFFALIGQTHRVERNEHKGFDYRDLVAALATQTSLVLVESIHHPYWPRNLSFGVGIVVSSEQGSRH